MEHVLFRIDVRVVPVLAAEGGFGAKHDDERESDSRKDGHKVKSPSNTEGLRNLSYNNRSEKCAAKDGKVGKGHADTTLVDKVHVTNGGVQQTLVRRNADALDGASPGHALVSRVERGRGWRRIVVGIDGASPRAAANDDAQSEDEEMALAPDTARGHEEDDGSASASEEVSSEDNGHVEGRSNGIFEPDGIRCEDRAKTGREDAGPAENRGDEIALPQRPVERVVGVIGWLRSLHTTHG